MCVQRFKQTYNNGKKQKEEKLKNKVPNVPWWVLFLMYMCACVCTYECAISWCHSLSHRSHYSPKKCCWNVNEQTQKMGPLNVCQNCLTLWIAPKWQTSDFNIKMSVEKKSFTLFLSLDVFYCLWCWMETNTSEIFLVFLSIC